MHKLPITLPALITLLAAACSSGKSETPAAKPVEGAATETNNTNAETQKMNAFFSGVFLRTVNRSPLIQGYIGIKKDNDKWDDLSEARALEDHELAKGDLKTLRSDYDMSKLDHQGKLSYRLFEYRLRETIDDFEWRHHSYPVNQMFGIHSQVPAFLINFHPIDALSDAEAYIKRLDALPKLLGQVEDNMRVREEKGIVPPKFVFPMAIADSLNIIKGAPFDDSKKDSTILEDFRKKLNKLEGVADDKKQQLIAEATRALRQSVMPAYKSLVAALHKQEKIATTDAGVWKLPKGGEFYARALRKTTTTNMTPEEIHELGVKEVARIHDEMRAISKKVGFKGSLQDFFTFMKTDKQFYFANTQEGRDAYLKGANQAIEQMRAKLDTVFITKPKAGLVVKPVEEYRADSAGLAFYNPPSLDGKRDGIYYVNLFDMAGLSKYETEALAFHEGIPGHHMQNAIAMEQEDLPMFRRLVGYTAYGEGWGLYSELLAKEMGFYQDPYSDFGRLSMELWRACRLVIDTGIHYKKWTREQAIEYLGKNTPGSDRDVRKAVERYIVMPSQATAYKIGMIEILRMRAKAKEQLGAKFDIREFHEAVLTNGPMPLSFVEEVVDSWIAEKQRA